MPEGKTKKFKEEFTVQRSQIVTFEKGNIPNTYLICLLILRRSKGRLVLRGRRSKKDIESILISPVGNTSTTVEEGLL